ncbi:MAG: peptidylprolyl isomerase [Candidatus Kapabacteria bacterium]|jgi:peptidyl-prolyl cis-trans isomerase SurA|nr:peptidylprolyl isomerase [Candidatus Kapabacteria bacterium]
MKIKHLLAGFLSVLFFQSFAQNTPKEVLFTIDEKPFYTDEFVRVYNKNLDLVKDESQKNPDNYLELFTGYKLKIAKAYKLGLQENQKYINELKSYRNQLAKNYLTDSQVTEELIEEGYNRLTKEIHASHILILCDENATAEDTLKAFRKVKEIRERAVKGEDFGKLAQELSEDPSAKDNKGDLGYFSAFRMVYPFESAAYNTPAGQISNPIRTKFGYHLVKVHDIRNHRGDITVAHIMTLNSQKDDADENAAIEKNIRDIYKKIKQGEDFEVLAKQFSQDKSSASRGGLLNRFSSGQLSSEVFENVAFMLTPENPLSEPFQSQFGWHIVKLIEKHPVKTFEEMRSDIETRISRDERSRLIAASMNEKLRKKYVIKRNDKQYQTVVKSLDDDVYKNEWKMPENLDKFQDNLVTVHNKNFTGADFLSYIYAHQKGSDSFRPIQKYAENRYQSFVDAKLNEVYNDNLENEFPEFAAVMEEYRDGLLLFDLMEKEIWEKSKIDTVGLADFHQKNIQKYTWKNRIEGEVYSTTSQKVANDVHKLLKKKKNSEEIKEVQNTDNQVNIMVSKGVFEEGNESLPKTYSFKEGLSDVIKDGNYYYIVKADKYLSAGPKTLEECKGRAINDYQQYLEENWVSELKKEFKISLNREVFEKLKKQMGY